MNIGLYTPEFYKQCKDFLIDIDRLHLLKNENSEDGYTLVELAMEYHKFIEKQVRETYFTAADIKSVLRKYPKLSNRRLEGLLRISMNIGVSPTAALCFHNHQTMTISNDDINKSSDALDAFEAFYHCLTKKINNKT